MRIFNNERITPKSVFLIFILLYPHFLPNCSITLPINQILPKVVFINLKCPFLCVFDTPPLYHLNSLILMPEKPYLNRRALSYSTDSRISLIQKMPIYAHPISFRILSIFNLVLCVFDFLTHFNIKFHFRFYQSKQSIMSSDSRRERKKLEREIELLQTQIRQARERNAWGEVAFLQMKLKRIYRNWNWNWNPYPNKWF